MSDVPAEPLLQEAVVERVAAAIRDQWCSAASVVVLHEGRVLARHGSGVLGRIGDDGRALAYPQPSDIHTWFDLASVTKVFSAVTLLTLVERGVLGLDAPIGVHLPSFAEGERSQVTLRMLLSHTSGLPAQWWGWRTPLGAAGREELLEDLLATPLVHAPGSAWEYSCVGYNTAMALAEGATGRPWAELVASFVLEPLGLGDHIAFVPGGSVAATEYQPELGRGVVQGVVHDESAWSLGGECANAGLFGAADGLARFGELVLLDQLPCSSLPLFENALPEGMTLDVAGHSLGLRIGEEWMHSPQARGHTGFTGTSLMVDRSLGLVVVVLANRVHPRRSAEQMHRLRQEVSGLAVTAVRASDAG